MQFISYRIESSSVIVLDTENYRLSEMGYEQRRGDIFRIHKWTTDNW